MSDGKGGRVWILPSDIEIEGVPVMDSSGTPVSLTPDGVAVWQEVGGIVGTGYHTIEETEE